MAPKKRHKISLRVNAVLRGAGIGLSEDAARRIVTALDALGEEDHFDPVEGNVESWAAHIHGAVLKHLDVPAVDGNTLRLPVVGPVALLAFFSGRRAKSADFLEEHVGNKVSRLVVWCDDTTPGWCAHGKIEHSE